MIDPRFQMTNQYPSRYPPGYLPGPVVPPQPQGPDFSNLIMPALLLAAAGTGGYLYKQRNPMLMQALNRLRGPTPITPTQAPVVENVVEQIAPQTVGEVLRSIRQRRAPVAPPESGDKFWTLKQWQQQRGGRGSPRDWQTEKKAWEQSKPPMEPTAEPVVAPSVPPQEGVGIIPPNELEQLMSGVPGVRLSRGTPVTPGARLQRGSEADLAGIDYIRSKMTSDPIYGPWQPAPPEFTGPLGIQPNDYADMAFIARTLNKYGPGGERFKDARARYLGNNSIRKTQKAGDVPLGDALWRHQSGVMTGDAWLPNPSTKGPPVDYLKDFLIGPNTATRRQLIDNLVAKYGPEGAVKFLRDNQNSLYSNNAISHSGTSGAVDTPLRDYFWQLQQQGKFNPNDVKVSVAPTRKASFELPNTARTDIGKKNISLGPSPSQQLTPEEAAEYAQASGPLGFIQAKDQKAIVNVKKAIKEILRISSAIKESGERSKAFKQFLMKNAKDGESLKPETSKNYATIKEIVQLLRSKES